MADQISNYQCPACTGPLHYGSGSGKLECDYCGSSFSVDEIESLYAQQNAEAAQAAQAAGMDESEQEQVPEEFVEAGGTDNWQFNEEQLSEETGGMKAYNCPSCGAELMCEETTAATSCPYCDNPSIVPASISGTLKPDGVLPFKHDKDAAKEAFRKHLSGRKLLPKLFSKENHLDEIKGVYVPFWLFDVDARANMRYSGTRMRVWSDRQFNYTETRYYYLDRRGRIGFDNIPVDGAEKIENELMESLEPYDFSEVVDFKSAYLTGYFADRYDVEAEDSFTRVKQRVRESTEAAFISTTAGYMGVAPLNSSVSITRGKGRYILLPVWLLNTTWRGKRYVFAMNGQTGKFVGDLPVDGGLAWKWRLIYGGIAAAVFAALSFFL